MALFNFELFPTESIEPWGKSDAPTLSWFALTLGTFHMRVGEQVLFEYSDEIRKHWGCSDPIADPPIADYQIAEFARDMLGCVLPAITRLPASIEALASDPNLADELYASSYTKNEKKHFRAWRWRGERSPWTNYLVASPAIWFVRIDDAVHVRWDNRNRTVDSIPVWTATHGQFALPVEAFIGESREFANQLLAEMEVRLTALEVGTMTTRTSVDFAHMREQHEWWRREFDGYFCKPYCPDVGWDETEAALRSIAQECGVSWPESARTQRRRR